jgi:acyl-CoA synthetase (AMP-forming)/AMP-acid ligase II
VTNPQAADRDHPAMNVADTITRHASERPYAVAIIEADKIIHYATFERAVWAAAAHLRRSGIAAGDVVGISLPHSALYLVAVYALARLGAVQVSLPLFDPPPVRAAYARRFAVKWLLAANHDAALAGLPLVLLQDSHVWQGSAPVSAELRFAGGEHPWFIRRTSGTTNDAKGIAITHRAALADLAAHSRCFPCPEVRYLAIV